MINKEIKSRKKFKFYLIFDYSILNRVTYEPVWLICVLSGIHFIEAEYQSQTNKITQRIKAKSNNMLMIRKTINSLWIDGWRRDSLIKAHNSFKMKQYFTWDLKYIMTQIGTHIFYFLTRPKTLNSIKQIIEMTFILFAIFTVSLCFEQYLERFFVI